MSEKTNHSNPSQKENLSSLQDLNIPEKQVNKKPRSEALLSEASFNGDNKDEYSRNPDPILTELQVISCRADYDWPAGLDADSDPDPINTFAVRMELKDPGQQGGRVIHAVFASADHHILNEDRDDPDEFKNYRYFARRLKDCTKIRAEFAVELGKGLVVTEEYCHRLEAFKEGKWIPVIPVVEEEK